MTLNRWLFLTVLLVGSTLGALAFGNPQWGKWIYMFQAYTLEHHNYEYTHQAKQFPIIETAMSRNEYYFSMFPIPKGYTGRWRHWNENGMLMLDMNLTEGQQDGEYYVYRSNVEIIPFVWGPLHEEGWFSNSTLRGECRRYSENGELRMNNTYQAPDKRELGAHYMREQWCDGEKYFPGIKYLYDLDEKLNKILACDQIGKGYCIYWNSPYDCDRFDRRKEFGIDIEQKFEPVIESGESKKFKQIIEQRRNDQGLVVLHKVWLGDTVVECTNTNDNGIVIFKSKFVDGHSIEQTYNDQGNLEEIFLYDGKSMKVVVFSQEEKIDRRAEFEIPIA